MSDGALLAMLRVAEDRLRQLEYRIGILETQQGQADQLLASLRSANSSS
jgi:hypothetical protein